MRKNKRVILMSLFIVAAAMVLLEVQRHQGSRLTTQIASNASGAGVGVVSLASNGPGNSIGPTRLTNSLRVGSQGAVVAGAAGARKATP
jgi:hypothetical protein